MAQDALKTAAAATRARIRRDRARAPRVLRKVFTVLASRLFDPSLNATRTWQAVRGNLANALARAGKIKRAAKELGRARQLNRAIDDPLGTPKLDCIDGLISERHGDVQAAKKFYLAALEGFRDAGELRYFGVVSVDLMVFHSTQSDWERVGALAAETLPILSSQRLHSETLATVGVLAQAIEAGGLSRRLLNELRNALRQDPLAM